MRVPRLAKIRLWTTEQNLCPHYLYFILAYGQYKDSKKTGDWIWYGEDGQIQVEKKYDNN